MPSISAATLEAWHRRVQWSTLFEPKPVRTSFWNRYASSLVHLAEPKPASDRLPYGHANLTKSFSRNFERLFPGGFAEYILPVVGIDDEILALGHTGLADQRFGQAMLVLDVVESVAPLYAQAA